jgi:branched-chain amino acid transport system ATP-binding protein
MSAGGPLLEVADLTKHFDAVKAADHLSLRIDPGEIVGVVGPNGSGKTTFLNLVTGYIKPGLGHIFYRAHEITGLHPRQITAMGIARSFQIPQLYLNASILENLLIALAIHGGDGRGFWKPLHTASREQRARQVLEQFGFRNGVNQPVTTLPEGARKLLDVALSFALEPALLLLDEPTSGVSVSDKFGVMDTLIDVIKQAGTTTVFVEHDMDVVQRYAGRVLVFAEGSIIADTSPDRLLTDPAVRQHILGTA